MACDFRAQSAAVFAARFSWGLREGAAALLWAAAELDVAQGVAISISYGLVVLLSTLPGAWVLARRAP
ncbi:hypothetical protein [Thauera humireducens]|uniref:Uncharacterized protein n=1 Tax=Thauera humireducens TaxID=1134435 RepID=A0A127K464_9RHOO|nr:hypothetical protein [Thauera humireducens]AMO36752.1 hypothetical protein AC731_007215 [Thauera humireducens]